MQRIAIDMDEVLADTAAHQLAWYERDFGPGITMADLHGKHFHTLVPEAHRPRVREHLHHPTFFRDIPLMAGAVDAIRTLSARYEIFIASAAMEHPVSFTAKFEWLREHFPDIAPSHCVFCGDRRRFDIPQPARHRPCRRPATHHSDVARHPIPMS